MLLKSENFAFIILAMTREILAMTRDFAILNKTAKQNPKEFAFNFTLNLGF